LKQTNVKLITLLLLIIVSCLFSYLIYFVIWSTNDTSEELISQ
jgi:hypothetical protein